ncbi:lariat debranching enzyme [Parahypoxylon ruwenzoriense]
MRAWKTWKTYQRLSANVYNHPANGLNGKATRPAVICYNPDRPILECNSYCTFAFRPTPAVYRGKRGDRPEGKKARSSKKKSMRENGIRVAIEGCGHGTLDAIYASVAKASKARGWDNVDLLIIGGDFQAVRNATDLTVMSVPEKYQQLGDFPAYYRGDKTAPYTTIFIGGNHEASGYLSELYYGGWVAPNIYYLGHANVLRFGPLRIAGLSGIWASHDYPLSHHERLPFKHRDKKSFYHVRELEVRKLLLIREQVDIGLSHDWPCGIEHHGNTAALFEKKPQFKTESLDGRLGNPAAADVMDRLRPAFWFSAHMHCKHAAIKVYKDSPTDVGGSTATGEAAPEQEETPAEAAPEEATVNPDEIDLDMDDIEGEDSVPLPQETQETQETNEINETNEIESTPLESTAVADGGVSEELRAQLPASFARPEKTLPKPKPGQPVPPTITNTMTRFLALDKCLPRREYLQLLEVKPVNLSHLTRYPPTSKNPLYRLQYDPEWLAITRVFAPTLTFGKPGPAPPDLGEDVYRPLIDREREWVQEHIVRTRKLTIPENFAPTAPAYRPGVDHASVPHDYQPDEYTNPQTTAFCSLLDVPNLWDATPEERAVRRSEFMPPLDKALEKLGPPGPGSSRGGGRGGHRGGYGSKGRGGGRGGRRK